MRRLGPLYDAIQVETALCLLEAVLDLREGKTAAGEQSDTAKRLDELFDKHGSYTMRGAVRNLIEACDSAWEAASVLDSDQHICFDLEFCPNFIVGALESGVFEEAVKQEYAGGTISNFLKNVSLA